MNKAYESSKEKFKEIKPNISPFCIPNNYENI